MSDSQSRPPSKPFRLSRRALLRGAGGVAIALPWLEAMGAREARAATVAPKRFLAVYTPGGTVLEKWRPTGTETAFDLSPILAPFEPVKNRLLIPDGLVLLCGDQLKFAVEQCQGGMVGWLTGQVQPGAGNFPKMGPSIDQVLAPALSAGKRFESYQMAVRWGTGKSHGKVTPMDVSTFARQEPYAPLPPKLDPVQIWNDLFKNPATSPAAWDHSILDAVDRRYARLAQKLGAADRRRLEAHLTHVRELEQRVAAVATCKAPTLVDTSDYNPTSGLASSDDGSIVDLPTDNAIPKVGKLMLDMMVMAFACDLTAVGHFQWGDAEGKHTYPWLSLPQTLYFYSNGGGYHPPECQKIFTWYSTQSAYLLQELAKVDVGGHSLLDETLVFFGTELQSPNAHSKTDMPFLLAGAGLKTGRWVRYPDAPPHNNLLVSLLNIFGDPRTTFGDSRCCTGPLPGLT